MGEAQAAVDRIQGAVTTLEAQAADIKARVQKAADECADKVQKECRDVPLAPPPVSSIVDGVSVPSMTPPPLPPDLNSMSDKQVRAWWTSLPPAEREALGRSDPLRWGNHPGVPPTDRDWINRLTAAGIRKATEDKLRAAGLPVPRTLDEANDMSDEQRVALGWGRYLQDPETGTRFFVPDPTKAPEPEKYLGALSLAQSSTGLERPAERPLLIKYEPDAFEGRGRTMVSIGDPETADNVAVFVPGRGSKSSNIDSSVRDTQRLVRGEPDRHEQADLRRHVAGVRRPARAPGCHVGRQGSGRRATPESGRLLPGPLAYRHRPVVARLAFVRQHDDLHGPPGHRPCTESGQRRTHRLSRGGARDASGR